MIRNKKISQSSSRTKTSRCQPVKKSREAKQSSEITKGQTRSEEIWVAVGKGERIGVRERMIIQKYRAREQLFYPIQTLTRHPESCLSACQSKTRHCLLSDRPMTVSQSVSTPCAAAQGKEATGMLQRSSKNDIINESSSLPATLSLP